MLIFAGALVAGGVAAFAAWFGVFTTIDISERRFDGGLFYYLDYQGHIKNIGSQFQKICSHNSNILGERGYPSGIYYDDPNAIQDQNLLRASTGLLVKSPDDASADIEQKLKSHGFKKVLLPAAKSLYGKFPVKTRLSCVLGAMKFYPKLNKMLSESGDKYEGIQDSSSIEVIEGGHIHYYFLTEKYKEIQFSPYSPPELKPTSIKGLYNSKKEK